MNRKQVRQILKDMDFIHTSGTAEELRAYAEQKKD